MKFSASAVRTSLITASLLLGQLGTVQAQSANQVRFEHALAEDATHVAKAQSISTQDAMARLKIDDALASPIAQLRSAYDDRLAGIYIEHDPSPRIVIRLKGAALQSTRFFDTSAGVIPVDFIPGAAHTKAELHSMIETKLTMLKQTLPGLQGIATDDKTGDVVLDILGDGTRASKLQGVANSILGVKTRVRALSVPLKQHVTGSGSIDAGTCTGAFVVQKTDGSATGLLTAGHCPNDNAIYNDLNGTTASLTFKAEAYTASNDVQWYTTNTTNQPIFYAAAGTPRTLTGRRTQASTAVGTNVCHYGTTSGYSCGDVEFTDYQPTSYTCNGVPCAATYIAVTGPGTNNTLACGAGDSGGPWFISTVALGVHSGGASTGPQPGACLVAIYTSTDRISELGLQLLYGQ